MKINNLQSEAASAAPAQQARTADVISLGKAIDSLSHAAAAGSSDAVSLSGVAIGIEAAFRTQATERQNRIDELQRRIADGSYQVEAKELGKAIIRDLTSEGGTF